jgi:hypothetical protein
VNGNGGSVIQGWVIEYREQTLWRRCGASSINLLKPYILEPREVARVMAGLHLQQRLKPVDDNLAEYDNARLTMKLTYELVLPIILTRMNRRLRLIVSMRVGKPESYLTWGDLLQCGLICEIELETLAWRPSENP